MSLGLGLANPNSCRPASMMYLVRGRVRVEFRVRVS